MDKDLHQRLSEHWNSLTRDVELDEAKSVECLNYLSAQYNGSDRHYHNIRHIVAMLDGIEDIKQTFNEPNTATLATFFHDVIYDPARSDNEAQSALQMHKMLKGHLPDKILGSAAYAINATKKHEATPSGDTNLVVDLDMAILGQPWDIYERYAAGVMKEYLCVYSKFSYRIGRATLFLKPTIAKGKIFLTPQFAHLDAPALRNLQKELEIITSGAAFSDQ